MRSQEPDSAFLQATQQQLVRAICSPLNLAIKETEGAVLKSIV